MTTASLKFTDKSIDTNNSDVECVCVSGSTRRRAILELHSEYAC